MILVLLFNSEDIDSAGVVGRWTDRRKGEEGESKDKKEDAAAEKEVESARTTASIIAQVVAKAVKSAGEISDRLAGGRPGSTNNHHV